MNIASDATKEGFKSEHTTWEASNRLDVDKVAERTLSKLDGEGLLESMNKLPKEKQKLAASAVANAERLQMLGEKLLQQDSHLRTVVEGKNHVFDETQEAIGELDKIGPVFREKIVKIAEADDEEPSSEKIKEAVSPIGSVVQRVRARNSSIYGLVNSEDPIQRHKEEKSIRERDRTIKDMEGLVSAIYKHTYDLEHSA